jgi:hypothetical protein
VLAAWSEAARILDLVGISRRRAETRIELATRVSLAGVLSVDAQIALEDLARLATSASYGVQPPGEAGLRQALSDARAVVRSARSSVARWQLITSALDPRTFAG